MFVNSALALIASVPCSNETFGKLNGSIGGKRSSGMPFIRYCRVSFDARNQQSDKFGSRRWHLGKKDAKITKYSYMK